MSHRLATRNGRRFRRARRRGHMIPAEANRVSTRAREDRWPVTKTISRRHHYPKSWYFKQDWNEE
jgi:hypothetical protein